MARTQKKRRAWLKIVLFGAVVSAVAVLILRARPPHAQTERRELAVDMQKEFRKHGLAYDVATSGADDTVLRIKAPSMTKPFAEFLVKQPEKSERLAGYGFTTVVFANDRGGNWTYDIVQRRLR